MRILRVEEQLGAWLDKFFRFRALTRSRRVSFKRAAGSILDALQQAAALHGAASGGTVIGLVNSVHNLRRLATMHRQAWAQASG